MQVSFISYTFTEDIIKKSVFIPFFFSFYSGKKKFQGGHNESLSKIYKKIDLKSQVFLSRIFKEKKLCIWKWK